MSNEQANQLLQQGIAAARAGEKDQARRFITNAIKLDPLNEMAWLWMSSVANDDNERIFCLRKVLEINPNNPNAIKGMQKLGQTPPGSGGLKRLSQSGSLPSPTPPSTGRIKPLTGPITPPTPGNPDPNLPPRTTSGLRRLGTQAPPSQQPPTPPPTPASGGIGGLGSPLSQIPTGGLGTPRTGNLAGMPMPPVPIIDERRLNAALSGVERTLSGYREVPAGDLPFNWVEKTRNRIGELGETALRVRIAVMLGIAVLILGGLGFGAFSLITSLTGGNAANLFNTATPSPTATPTATATPGLTATPSRTPRAAVTATRTPNFPPGSVFNRQPTPLYPNVRTRPMQQALALFTEGKYADALAILEDERKGGELIKDENYYSVIYYMVLAHLAEKQPNRAAALLDANRNPDSPSFRAARAELAFARGDFPTALTDATEALRGDPQFVRAAVIAAQIQTRNRNFAAARRLLNDAIADNPQNVVLLVERARTQLAAGNPADAVADGELALYIDPVNREAFVVRNEALLAAAAAEPDPDLRVEAYGRAVVGAQGFLLFYPGETLAWVQLGRARQGEGNLLEALNAYSQAVVVDTTSEDARQAFEARGRLLLARRQYELARADFESANRIRESADLTRLHLEASRGMGDYVAALDDASFLLKTAPNDTSLIALQYELLTLAWARGQLDKGQFEAAGAALTDEKILALGATDQPAVYLYRGVLRYESEQYADALTDLNRALAARSEWVGHEYRARALLALGRDSEAIRDLQWLAFWRGVYNYPPAQGLDENLATLSARLPTETATPTATLTPSNTPTPSHTPTASNTPTITLTPSRTLSPTRTPTITRTPTLTRTPTRGPSPTPTLDGG